MSDGREFKTYFSSKHLRAVDLPVDGHTFRITEERSAPTEDKNTVCELILRDAEAEGISWFTNITNCEYMTRIYGSKLPEDWVGHLVTIRNDPTVKRGKETVGGIRVMGSPELTAPITFEYQENERKRARQVTLRPTGNAPQAAVVNTEAPSGASGAESDTGAADGTIPGRGAKSAQGELA